MSEEIKLSWDGEAIKQEVKVDTVKFSPKDMLDGIANAEGQLDQMEGQVKQLENNLRQLKDNIVGITKYIKERVIFKEKCKQLQFEKLGGLIGAYSNECKKVAEELTAKAIKSDPNAYTDAQKDNMNYVNYQRQLAIHPKIANKISAEVIKIHLFEKPIFDNPF